MNERLLTARELGEILGVKPGTVLNWYEAKKLPGYKLGGTPGGRVRFRLSDVDVWRTGAGGEAPATPSKRPSVGVVSHLPATPQKGGEDA
jgi:excisionase family DNA binding protein